MKSQMLKKLPWIGPILFAIKLLSDLDGVLNFFSKFNVKVSMQNWEWFIGLINQLMLLYLVIITTFLLRQYFKNSEINKKQNDQRELERVVMIFYMRHSLQSIQGRNGSDRDKLNDFIREEMHNVWGDSKTDSEINRLAEEFIRKIGHAPINTSLRTS